MYAAPDAYLRGRRYGQLEFELLDKAAEGQPAVFHTKVPRKTVDDLVAAGYIESPDPRTESGVVTFVLSAAGRKKLSEG